MADETPLAEREVDEGEDAFTADIPVTDPATAPEDLGDEAPPGETHEVVPELDPALGLTDEDLPDIFEVADDRLAPIGLNARDRTRARDLAVAAAALALRNSSAIEYSMGTDRWDPIKRDRKAFRGEFGKFEDCSSFATWCLWNGLDHFAIKDVVNAQKFQAGWTGSMLGNGQRVSRAEVLRGDCVFYLKQGTREVNHVALCVGGGMVISHGSEPGPLKLRIDYRTIAQIRRYIRA
jgi:hypothetical protein